ncbi:MAG: gliding motility-associated C-terminal domain-containing protein [Bacteroidota bacterium]
MKTPFTFSFLIFNFSFLISFSQVWYFGNGAGLNFSSGTVKSIHDGKFFTLEGCATACDNRGQLLFYTDGITVWNGNHDVMQNGERLNGSKSSTQSALIVPQPETKGFFFLFTTDEMAGKKGCCYSVINVFSGEGVVTKKNIQLLASSTEKITAVQHANGKDVWVIAHQWNSNSFFVFPITSQGVGKPIISTVGGLHAETGAGNNREAIGCLRVSNDGKKIAVALCYRMKNNLEIFDFDNATGKISNPSTVSVDGFPYGLCFSPNNTQLYISFLKGENGIIQYDMTAKIITQIIDNEKENSFGSLQVGLNGKIYIARTGNFLDAIESPNEKGYFCKYKKNAINLSPASSNYGLPNFWSSTFSKFEPLEKLQLIDCSKIIEKPFSNKEQLLMTEISVCENEYILNAKNFGASFNWSTLQTTQKINIDTTGIYRVSISKNGCTITDSIRLRFRKDATLFRFLPAFNPESEFLNSEFYYDIDDVQEFELKVFDGKKKNILFETQNLSKKWNGKNQKGKIVPAGEYFWSVKYKPNCPKESKLVTQEGRVIVKRKIISSKN